MPKTFRTFDGALSWAKVHAREHHYPFQLWRIVKRTDGQFAIGIFSRNTGASAGFVLA